MNFVKYSAILKIVSFVYYPFLNNWALSYMYYIDSLAYVGLLMKVYYRKRPSDPYLIFPDLQMALYYFESIVLI